MGVGSGFIRYVRMTGINMLFSELLSVSKNISMRLVNFLNHILSGITYDRYSMYGSKTCATSYSS